MVVITLLHDQLVNHLSQLCFAVFEAQLVNHVHPEVQLLVVLTLKLHVSFGSHQSQLLLAFESASVLVCGGRPLACSWRHSLLILQLVDKVAKHVSAILPGVGDVFVGHLH